MLARRVAHLALAPGAVPSAVLVAVVGLIWFSTGRFPLADFLGGTTASLSQPPPSAITYRGMVTSDAPPVTLPQAIASAQRFAAEPGLELEGGLQDASLATALADMYYLETAGFMRGEDFFKVDARTGEVIEATFRSRLGPSIPPMGMPVGDAEQVAWRYAHERFFGFDELTLVDRTSRASETSMIYSFKWSKLATETGAELPVSVSVALSGGSGEVVWYLAQRDPLQVDTRPSVDRVHALQVAIAGLGGRDSRWDTERPLAVRLQVLYDDYNRQQLTWSITLRSRQPTARPTIRLLVNAHTGQLLASPT